MTLDEYDISNIKILATTIKNFCVKFDYKDSKTAEKIYEIDNCARKILSIVEKT